MKKNLKPLPDTELVALAKSGDSEAFAELYNRFSGETRSYAVCLVKDRNAADDIVQETWINILNHIKDYEGRSPFKAWVIAIAKNECLDYFRVIKRRLSLYSLAGSASEMVSLATIDEKKRIDLREELALVRTLVKSLPERQRDVVILHCIEGLTFREIHALRKDGPSIKTWKVNLSEGRKRLLGKIAEVEPGARIAI